MPGAKFESVDADLASLPAPQRAALEAVRGAVLAAIPGVEESIAYNMPSYHSGGPILQFAAFKRHSSTFGEVATLSAAIKTQVGARSESGGGTIRFRYDEPVPVKLVAAIAKERAKRNRAARR